MVDKSYIDEANQIALELMKDHHSGAQVVQEQQASVNARSGECIYLSHFHNWTITVVEHFQFCFNSIHVWSSIKGVETILNLVSKNPFFATMLTLISPPFRWEQLLFTFCKEY